MLTISSLLSLILTTAATPSVAVDPYAATASGWSHCFEPRESDKTCEAIITYRRVGDHTYESHAVAALRLSDYIIEYDQRLTVVDGKDCAPYSRSVLQNLRYRRGARYLVGPETTSAEQALGRLFVGAGHVRVCSTIAGDGNNLVSTAQVLGEPKPGYFVILRTFQMPVRWIHSDDGFTVRTWSATKS